jgi:hypothetical protein
MLTLSTFPWGIFAWFWKSAAEGKGEEERNRFGMVSGAIGKIKVADSPYHMKAEERLARNQFSGSNFRTEDKESNHYKYLKKWILVPWFYGFRNLDFIRFSRT